MSAKTFSGYFCCIFVALVAGMSVQQDASPEESIPKISLEAELERGEKVSRLILFIRNSSSTPYTFQNGSRGGAGSLDDGFRFEDDKSARHLQDLKDRWTIGTVPTVVPEFVFKFGDAGVVNFRAPTFSGPTKRAMRPHKVTINPHSRVQYASFAVPTRIVSGNLVEAKLDLPDRTLRMHKMTVKCTPSKDK